jgi:hypothetical protein
MIQPNLPLKACSGLPLTNFVAVKVEGETPDLIGSFWKNCEPITWRINAV